MSEGKLLDQFSLKMEKNIIDKTSIPSSVRVIGYKLPDKGLAVISFSG
jgi:hypothetical protein